MWHWIADALGWRRESAIGRGARLLVEHLSVPQRFQYRRERSFEVVGGDTGKKYRIFRADLINVAEVDDPVALFEPYVSCPKAILFAGTICWLRS